MYMVCCKHLRTEIQLALSVPNMISISTTLRWTCWACVLPSTSILLTDRSLKDNHEGQRLHWCYPRIGFLTAIRYVLRLKKGGCLFGGLPCSAHVWIASGTTGKNRSCPRGDMTVPATQKGNCLASHFCLLALIAVARQSYWGGEVHDLIWNYFKSKARPPKTGATGYDLKLHGVAKKGQKRKCVSKPLCTMTSNNMLIASDRPPEPVFREFWKTFEPYLIWL